MSVRHLAIAFAIVLVLIVSTFFANGYQLFVLSLVGLTAIVGIGLNILLGLTGQISLGHVGFYAIGAYTVGILTTSTAVGFWPTLLIAGVVAGAAGALLAIPALRVRGPYLAMVTIAFGFIVEQGAAEWSDLTGGWNGLVGIPMPSLFGFDFGQREIAIFVVLLTAFVLFLYARLASGPWGKAMRAIRDSETAAQSIGLDPILLRATAFSLSAALAGIAGGVFAAMSSFISPESFPFFESILFLLVVMIGGADTVLGPIVGAVIVVLLPEMLSWLAEYRLLLVGALLLVVLRLAPGGIVGLVSDVLRKRRPTRAATSAEGDPPFLKEAPPARTLAAQGLSISFGGVRAVQDVTFEAKPGGITSIIGPNGAGKTTALNLVAGFYRPDSGSVRLGGDDLTGKRAHRVARAGVARTYQTTQLFERMSVRDNLLIAMRRGQPPVLSVFASDDSRERLDAAEALLGFVGYKGDPHTPAGGLAHVDKRLVEIARALALKPDAILLDEPAAGLGDEDTRNLGTLLRRIARLGRAVILIEHDMSLVMGVSDCVVVLDAGRGIASGAPAEVQRNADVLKAYLGASTTSDRHRSRPVNAADTPPLLEAGSLGAAYGSSAALRGAELCVSEGEFVAVLGANGAGKSTLMHALSGLHRPVEGRILFLGRSIESMAANEVAGLGLVLVPEGRQVFPALSVADNIRLGAYTRPSDDIESDLERLLDRFPRLRERRDQNAGLLSGGEQQMLAIARGLIAQPKLLLLDEPSLGLAPALIDRLYDILAELREEGVTILLVDQMAEMALSLADRAYILESGQVRQSGPAAALRASRALQEAYLGGAAGLAGKGETKRAT